MAAAFLLDFENTYAISSPVDKSTPNLVEMLRLGWRTNLWRENPEWPVFKMAAEAILKFLINDAMFALFDR